MEAARIKLSQKALSELLIGFRTKFDRHKSSYKFTIKICGEKYSIYNWFDGENYINSVSPNASIGPDRIAELMYYLFTNNISLIDFLKSYEKKGMGEISKFINNI